MALLVPNSGEVEMLKRILGMVVTDSSVVVKLYSNVLTPIESSVVGDFTECVDGNYSALTTVPATWNVAGDPTEASYVENKFIFAGAQTINGYYVTNAANDILLWAEKFVDGPYQLPVGGGSIFVIPKIQLA